MNTKTIKNTAELAFDVSADKLDARFLVDEINNMLSKHNFNARFMIHQQNRYIHKDGEGSMLIGIFNDCEMVRQ